MTEAYSIAMCGERAHGHLRRIASRLTTSRLRVRTLPRSNVLADTPSEIGLEGLAQYSWRMISLDSRVQSCFTAAGEPALIELSTDTLCPLMDEPPVNGLR